LATPGQEHHHLAMHALLPRLQRQQALGERERRDVGATPAVVCDECIQRLHHLLAPTLTLALQPDLELGAPGERHPFHEIAPIEVHCSGQGRGTALCNQALKGVGIDAIGGAALQLDSVTVGEQAAGQEGGDPVQDPTEVGPRALLWLRLPEEGHELIARGGPALRRQVAEERQRLA